MKQLLKRIRESNILLEIVNGELKGYSNDRAIDPQLIKEIKDNKKELIRFLIDNDLEQQDDQQVPGISALPAAENYVLSSSQRRLWLLSQLEGGNTAYNIPGIYVFETYMDVAALASAFAAIIERHEILRTVFREDSNGEIKQVVLSPKEIGFTLGCQDLRGEDKQQVKLMQSVEHDFNTPFDLSKGPLLRASLYRLSDERYVLSYVMHHIISDARSMLILLHELELLYNAAVYNIDAAIPPLKIQYKDYAAWQQQQLNMPALQEHKAYWLKNLEGELPVVNLLPDKPRPAWKTFKGDAVSRSFQPGVAERLKTVLQEQQCTLFMGLMAAVNAVIYKYTAQDDIIIGSPIDGRDQLELENQIGFYLNTLALRTQFSGQDSFNTLLQKVKQVTMNAYDHQSYPFDELVDQLQLERDMSRNPLFDISVVLLDKEGAGSYSQQQEPVVHGLQNQVSKFDLSFDFSQRGDEIAFSLVYDTSIYERSTITQLADHLLWLTEQLVAKPNTVIDRLSCLTDPERYQQQVLFNRLPTPYPKDVSLIHLFEQRVQQTPAAIALVFEGKNMSYAWLNDQANQLAAYLRAQHTVGREDLVAILLERSEWMIIAILAVLKAGGAYVPVDPAYPQERIDYMIADSRCKVLIDHNEIAAFREQQHLYLNANVELINKPSDLAYVIYTSGSTGRPKGVMVEHQGVVNRLEWMWKQYHYTAEDVILQKTSFTFDVSVWEIFMPLCWGAKMVLCHKDDITSPSRILSLIKHEKITCLHFVPSMLNSFIDSVFDEAGICDDLVSLRCVITSGEALALETIKKWYNKVSVPVHNLYGPTEASVDVTHYTTSKDDTRIPIGRPIWNTQMYILDAQNELLPVGAMGEICISGDGLARGYLNKPELTAEKFIENPFQPGKKMYKTGDFGRWLPDGNIEYLGRKDHQVKIRGHRIELGEIESAIRAYDGVTAAVVTAQVLEGERELIAYVSSRNELDRDALRSRLQKLLPAYMVPGYIIQLEKLPLTANGKIDRKQLRLPSGFDITVGNTYIAPRTETEKKLVDIWSDVLRIEKEKISVKANFFSVGGHSLKATKLAARIFRSFNVKIELRELFLHADIEQQAALIERAIKTDFSAIEKLPAASSYPLSASQRRLWVLSQFEAANIAYNIQGANVFKGSLDIDVLQRAFNTLVERHEILHTVIRPDDSGGARQYVLSLNELDFSIRQHDVRNKINSRSDLKQWIEKEFTTPFDLAKGPLLRASLYQVADDEWVFTYVVHHIISDGQSMEIMIKELLAIYNAFINNEPNPLTPLRIQYKDYAAWQQQQLSGPRLEEHKAYWLQQFEGELPVIELQSDRVRPARKTYNGSSIITSFNADVSKAIKDLSRTNDSTLFMAMLAAVNTLLYRYTNQEDIIIGTPIAGREHGDLEGQVGFYANTLALRTRFSGDDSYLQLLAKVKEAALGAYEHQVYPFDELVNALHLQRDVSRHPLFDMQVIVQNDEGEGEKTQSLRQIDVTHFTEAENLTSVFDIVFLFIERREGFRLVIMYNTDVYAKPQVELLSEHLQLMLAAIVQNPTLPIAELEFLSAGEKQLLLSDFNNSAATYPHIETLHGMVEAQAARVPDAVSLVFEKTVLTYKQLDEKANQLANHLVTNYGIGTGDLVGIMINKSEKLIIAILGILKSGAAYVPIDPEYPKPRKEFIIKDAAIKLLITGVDYFLDLDYFEGNIMLDAQLDTLTEPVTPFKANVSAEHLAYVIYTSGSTGTPKGVMIKHASIVNSIFAQIEAFGVEEHTKGLLFASASFDASITEIFMMIAKGASLYVISEEVRKNPSLMEKYISDNDLDMATLPPAFVRLLQMEKIKALKILVTAGEAASFDDAFSFAKYGNYFNAYGPTEASICATAFKLDTSRAIDNRNVPIGKPIGNNTIYILSDHLKLMPVGAAGEICIGGKNVGAGYLNKPALTNEKFVDDPFIPGGKMYRTGDLGRWLPNGNIEFIGRKDDQVKVRGNRVELGEIQAAISSIPGIESAAVIAKATSQGHKELVAYIVGSKELKVQELRNHLSTLLPSFMMPGHFVQLEQMPLTTNGKIDKRALPHPQGISISTDVEYVAPRDAMEEGLVRIWQRILEKENIGIKDGFFELGGDSIKILKMLAEFENEFKFHIPVAEVYKNDTIQQISEYVALNKEKIGRQNEEEKEKYAAVRKQFEELKERILSSGKILQKENIEDIYPMSDIEKGMVFESLASEGLGIYHSQMILSRSFANFDIKRFRLAMLLMVQKHSILRTAFNITDFEKEVQIVYKRVDIEIGHKDISGLNIAEQQQVIENFANAERSRPFDVTRAPLWRMDVFNTGKNNIVFVFQCHHAIIDGWSDALFLSELNNLYLKLNENPTHKPALLKSSYKDFIIEQEAYKADETIKDFWKQELADFVRLDLFTDEDEETRIIRQLDDGFVQQLETKAIELNTTVKAMSLAAFVYMLRTLNYDRNIVAGLVTNTRPNREDSDKLLGCFLNTIPFRFEINSNETCAQYIRKVHDKLISIKEYERLSMLEISRLFGKQSTSINPIFDVLIDYVDFHAYKSVKNDDSTQAEAVEESDKPGISAFARTNTYMDFMVERTGGGYHLNLRKRKKFRSGFSMEKIADLYTKILHHFVDGTELPLAKAACIDAVEHDLLLNGFNDTLVNYAGESVLQLFDQAVKQNPSAIALQTGAHQLTYQELQHQSNKLAAYLRTQYKLQPDDLAGIMLERSEKMIVSILGILKSGAAYVPIDPDYPAARKAHIMHNAGLKLLITQTDYIFDLDYYEGDVFAIDVQSDYLDAPDELPEIQTAEDDLAYVIYTSGSTGKPKGCAISRSNLDNYIRWANNYYFKEGQPASFGLFTSLSFDLTVTSIFCTLAQGGKLTIYNQRDELAEILRHSFSSGSGINCIKLTPSHINMLPHLAITQSDINCAIVGGEEVKPHHVQVLKNINPAIEIYNEYGPTETTVGCIIKQLEENTAVLIGRPIANAQVYIVNSEQLPVPIGVAGEICIGGRGVGKGYINAPELTAQKFISNSFTGEGMIYRTGDSGRWLENGEIEFFGRIDEQVKIRGYRIELGEIENAILSNAEIQSAVVIARTGSDGDKQLVAYIVSSEDASKLPDTLRTYLGKLLPAYMVPAHFVQLEKLPLTPNGKVDRKALSEIQSISIASASAYVAPRNELDEKLLAIWEKMLERTGLGIKAGFFENGGDSIRILRMLSELKAKLGIDVSISDAYKYTTVEKLADHITQNQEQIGERSRQIKEAEDTVKEDFRLLKERIFSSMEPAVRDSVEDIYPMSDIEKGMVFESMVNEASGVYHDQMVRPWIMPGFDIERLRKAVGLLIEKHPILRTSFNMLDYETEVQIVHKTISDPVVYHDITALNPQQQETEVREFISSELRNPFNFTVAPLWRICIFRCAENEIILVFQCHHSIIDGWSDTLLMTELNNLYLLLGEDAAYKPVPLKSSYKDCVIQHEVEKRDEQVRKFWREELKDYSRLDLFTDEENAEIIIQPADAALIEKLEKAALALNTTVKSISLGAYLYMLKVLSNENDIVTGLLTNLRPNCEDSDKILGCFLNTIPLKITIDGSVKCADFLSAVHDKMVQLKDKERLSLLDITLIHDKQLSFGNPFFDVLFNYVDFHEYASIKNPAASSPLGTSTSAPDIFGNIRGNTHFDFLVDRTLGAYKVIVLLNRKLKSGLSAENITQLYLQILDHIITNPASAINEAEYVNEEEKQKLLLQFNNTQAEYPHTSTIVDLFYQQVNKNPYETALVAEDVALIYTELNERSNQLAHYLQKNHRITKDDLIGIKLERSEWLVTAILAVLKCGAAYVPMDPHYPQDRIAYMIEDSHCITVIDEESLQLFRQQQKNYSADNPATNCMPKDLAYVIYTSGSTGKPKGVMIEHGNVVNFFSGLSAQLPVNENDCMLAVTSTSFDISVLELLWTLCNGVQVVLHSSASGLNTLDRYVATEDLSLDFSLFFFSSYNNKVAEKYNLLLESVKYADEQGFKAVWIPERHFHEFGGLYPNPSVVSSALAMITKQIELRSGSVVSPLHDAIRIAEEWSVVDNLSNGRVGLSFASGWNPNDFALSKYDFKERQKVMHEQIKTVKELWRGGSVTRTNALGKEVDLHIFPMPVQKEIPVWVTSSGNPETFISAGATGANLLTHFLGQDLQALGEKIKLYREARRKNGHDESAGKVTVMLHAFIGDDINEVEKIVEQPFIEYLKSSVGVSKITLEEAGIKESDLSEEVKDKILRNAFRRYYKTSALIGTVNSCSNMLKDLKEIGVDEVACLIDFGVEEKTVLDNLKNLKKLKTVFAKQTKKLHRPVTMMQSTPSFIKLAEEDRASAKLLQSLRSILIGGEALPLSLVKTINTHCAGNLYNMYGPTETTIWSCMHPIPKDADKVLIGKPMMNTDVYILNEELKLLPVGISGDLYIGGKGVARGYLNNEALTAERFIAHPFKQGERIYKTGDVARWLADGTIEFIGRKDNQVKLRGYRIEPGEIENALQAYAGIEAVAVTVRTNHQDEKELIAYLVSNQKLNTAELREWLSKSLPLFMIPDAFVQLDALPLTANGKIDRKKLPDPATLVMSTGMEYVAPRTPIEEKLTMVWQEVLGKEKVGIKDDYFELGGNSLKAMRVIKRIMDETGYSVPLTVLFTERNVENLALYIDTLNNSQHVDEVKNASASEDMITDLSYSQRTYFSEWYAKEAHVVVSSFEYSDIDIDAFRSTIKQLIARHEILRTGFINADGVIKQKILRVDEVDFEIPDPVTVSQQELEKITQQAYHTKFDMAAAPLLRVRIYRKKEGGYVILIIMHHILSDGYSANVTSNELPLLYAESISKKPSSLQPLAFQYRDFSAWQMNFVQSKEGIAHKDYWLKKLKGFNPKINLPGAAPAGKKHAGVVVNMVRTIDGSFYDEVDRFARKNSLSHAGLLLGTLTLVLHRLSGQQDLTVLTQVSGRDSKHFGRLDFTGLLGNFTNMLMVRNTISKTQPVIEYLKNVQYNFLEDLGYDAYPADRLLDELPGINQSGFLQSTVLFNYHNYSYLKDKNVITGQREEETSTRGNVPLQQAFILAVSEYDRCLELMFAFNKSMRDPSLRSEIRSLYYDILEQVIRNPQSTIDNCINHFKKMI